MRFLSQTTYAIIVVNLLIKKGRYEMDQYYICYPNGKFKALTFSYDDGKKADRRLISIFNKYGLKGTFHLNGGLFPEESGDQERIPKSEVKELYAGHEVAGHTYTHPTIARCPIEKVADEIILDRRALEELVDYPVQGFSYPNGSYNENIKSLLPLLGIEYARVVGNSNNFELPMDWFEWKASCHHNAKLMELGRQFVELHKSQYLYLMYVWGHSYEFDGDNNWDLIEEFAELVSKYEKDIWFVTNIEYKRYMEDAKRIVFSSNGKQVFNPNYQSIWIRINQKLIELTPGMNQLEGNS